MFPLALLTAPNQSLKHANELTTNSLKATTAMSDVGAEHSTRSLYIPSRKARGQEIRKEKQTPGWGRLNET